MPNRGEYDSGRGNDESCRSRTCLDPRAWFRSMANQKSIPNKETTSASSSHENHASGATTTQNSSSDSKSGEKAGNSQNFSNGPGTGHPPAGTDDKPCPLFVDELGRSSWNLLHSMAAKFPENPTEQQQKNATHFMQLFSLLYPCENCAKDMVEDLKALPVDSTSQTKFSLWMCQFHNRVNRKLGKPQFDCTLVRQRWRDGWDDESCN